MEFGGAIGGILSPLVGVGLQYPVPAYSFAIVVGILSTLILILVPIRSDIFEHKEPKTSLAKKRFTGSHEVWSLLGASFLLYSAFGIVSMFLAYVFESHGSQGVSSGWVASAAQVFFAISTLVAGNMTLLKFNSSKVLSWGIIVLGALVVIYGLSWSLEVTIITFFAVYTVLGHLIPSAATVSLRVSSSHGSAVLTAFTVARSLGQYFALSLLGLIFRNIPDIEVLGRRVYLTYSTSGIILILAGLVLHNATAIRRKNYAQSRY
jgi:hypothetical protein